MVIRQLPDYIGREIPISIPEPHSPFTDHHSLGDCFSTCKKIELPRIGDKIESHKAFGNVESVKAVSELFMPVAGEVIEVNSAIGDAPETLNADPYGKGWLIRIRIQNVLETAALMSAEGYDEYVAAQS